MSCDAHGPLRVHSCVECDKLLLADEEVNMSTASTEDIATDNLIDDDEAPPMVPLERNITITKYNELCSLEWQDPVGGMSRFEPHGFTEVPFVNAMPASGQPVCYMIPFVHVYPDPQSTLHSSGSGLLPVMNCTTGGAFCQRYDACSAYSQEWQSSIFSSTGTATLFGRDKNDEDTSEWCDRLLRGGEPRQQVLAALRGKVAELAFQQLGCRIVQQALDVAGTDGVRSIVTELHGHVQAAAWSPHANYVMQKVIEVLPPSVSAFVPQELQGVASAVARSKYGCRILCRIFEHASAEPESKQLADELFWDAGDLCRHIFAHHVMEVILKHSSPEQRQRIVNSLVADFWTNAQVESSSYVIECAMVHCTEQDMDTLLTAIATGAPGRLGSLLHGKPVQRVLRALSKMQSQLAKTVLQAMVRKLERNECQHVLNWQGKRFVLELSREAKLPVTA